MRRLKLVNTRFRRTLTIVIAARTKLKEKTMMLRKRLTLVHARLKKKRINVKKMKFDDASKKERNERSEKNEKNENENMREASVESAKDEKKK